jgi:glycosyltransferase involved in cell wall biosynthesis
MFNPCIIIPVYNHGKLLQKSIGKIAAYGHKIIIVDDGNAAAEKNILQEIASQNQNITLITLPENQGKGAAVIAGFDSAFQSGHSHALQIDADCQHNTDDIATFLATAQNNPNCLINGVPVYDEFVPKSRLYGRKITNFWVMVETRSRDIKDAMCGFRVYPLNAAIKLIKRHKISKRMGFDIEIIVRLHWMDVKIINQPTRVTYPKDGSSNFKMLSDNLKISWLHTRLVVKMLKNIDFS